LTLVLLAPDGPLWPQFTDRKRTEPRPANGLACHCFKLLREAASSTVEPSLAMNVRWHRHAGGEAPNTSARASI
jgi:hypothetical protein